MDLISFDNVSDPHTSRIAVGFVVRRFMRETCNSTACLQPHQPIQRLNRGLKALSPLETHTKDNVVE
jgi:hypothetical protein